MACVNSTELSVGAEPLVKSGKVWDTCDSRLDVHCGGEAGFAGSEAQPDVVIIRCRICLEFIVKVSLKGELAEDAVFDGFENCLAEVSGIFCAAAEQATLFLAL